MKPAQNAESTVVTTSLKVGKKRGPPKGQRYGGRVKGTPNKFNADLKEMILTALSVKGGAKYLVKQADLNPVAFMSLLGRVLPMTVVGDANQPLTFQIVSGVPRELVEVIEQVETIEEQPQPLQPLLTNDADGIRH